MLYTVYCREAGRVGHHKSYNIRIEDITDMEIGLTYEVRNLREHQLYEFWVSEYIPSLLCQFIFHSLAGTQSGFHSIFSLFEPSTSVNTWLKMHRTTNSQQYMQHNVATVIYKKCSFNR